MSYMNFPVRATAALPTNSQSVFVAKDGNDTTGSGSINNPYASVTKALSTITDAGPTKPYTILVGPGKYTETTLVLKGDVYLVGYGNIESLACRINVTGGSGNVTVDASTIVTGSRYGIANIYFSGSVGLTLDLTSAGGPSICVLNNTGFNGSITYTAKGDGEGLEAFGSTCYGNVTFNGATQVQIQNCLFIGDCTFNDSAATSIKGTVVGGQMNNAILNSAHKSDNFMQFFGVNLSTLTITQTSGAIYGACDSISFPYTSLTVNSGTFYRYTDVKSLTWNVTSTATSAGTLTLNGASNSMQIFTGSTTHTVTLPPANDYGSGSGRILILKNNSSGNITVNRAGSDTIDGATSKTITGGANNVLRLLSDGGTGWSVI